MPNPSDLAVSNLARDSQRRPAPPNFAPGSRLDAPQQPRSDDDGPHDAQQQDVVVQGWNRTLNRTWSGLACRFRLELELVDVELAGERNAVWRGAAPRRRR